MLTFDGRPLAYHYAGVMADHYRYILIGPDVYEPPGRPSRRTGDLYVPALYGFDTHLKLFIANAHLALYMTNEPLSGAAMIHGHMVGHPWPEEDLMALCNRVRDLPYGAQAAQVIIDQADFLDEHPEYRGLPRVAARHQPSGDAKVAPKPPPREWNW